MLLYNKCLVIWSHLSSSWTNIIASCFISSRPWSKEVVICHHTPVTTNGLPCSFTHPDMTPTVARLSISRRKTKVPESGQAVITALSIWLDIDKLTTDRFNIASSLTRVRDPGKHVSTHLGSWCVGETSTVDFFPHVNPNNCQNGQQRKWTLVMDLSKCHVISILGAYGLLLMYPSSHNHGSVENHQFQRKETNIGDTPIFRLMLQKSGYITSWGW